MAFKALHREREKNKTQPQQLLHSRCLPSDLFTGAHLQGVPSDQGFLVARVHLACPVKKTPPFTSLLCCHTSLNTSFIWSMSIYLQALLFHLVGHLFPSFQADPAYQYIKLIIQHLTITLPHDHARNLCVLMYTNDATHKYFFLPSSQEDLVVPELLWDPLCPGRNKQTTGHSHRWKRND